ncbi:hypothetical protein C8J57DRAFT_1368029 [Mycena rebaudengoi]|nr:hypothetical protein C8J57DRAFT_1368029 [Mycena rebaudengoi]
MPKTRTRLTVKKAKKAPRASLGLDPHAPTNKEWDEMPQYMTFNVSDEENNEFDFSVNDKARVLPNRHPVGSNLDPSQYWVCEILEIRAKSGTDVWAKVRWYYSARDVAAMVADFDPSLCGATERISSDHIDYISSSTFDGVATVKEYDEVALDQVHINSDEFYCRYHLDTSTKTVEPTPGADTCVCSQPYNPADTSPDHLMHFCARSSCRKYFHTDCLGTSLFDSPADNDQPELRLLLSHPDTDEKIVCDDASMSEPPKKKRRGAKRQQPQISNVTRARLASLPPALVRAAAQPIVKGAAFPAGGISGNIAAVVAARRLVHVALDRGLPDGWEETVDLDAAVVKLSVKGPAKAKVPLLVCPGCGDMI